MRDTIYDEERCLIKLHGDVTEMITYKDAKSEVFSQEQYLASLKKNVSLLAKLRHDITFQNIIYIGCSLDDELDLLSVAIEDEENKTARYICATKEPGVLDKLHYERFGITHIVLFGLYDSIYRDIYSAWTEAQQVRVDDLDSFKIDHANSCQISSDYNANKSYLFYGKSLIEKKLAPSSFLIFLLPGLVPERFSIFLTRTLSSLSWAADAVERPM